MLHTEANWRYLLANLEEDNRMRIDEALAEGWDVSGGTDYHVNANISVDDGGEIHTLELSEINE